MEPDILLRNFMFRFIPQASVRAAAGTSCSEPVARKPLLEQADVLEKFLQPSAFHAGVGVHHMFRYAGTQQPFLHGSEIAANASR